MTELTLGIKMLVCCSGHRSAIAKRRAFSAAVVEGASRGGHDLGRHRAILRGGVEKLIGGRIGQLQSHPKAA